MKLRDWILMSVTVFLFCCLCLAVRWGINKFIKPLPEVGTLRISIQVNGKNDTIYVIQEYGGYGDAWINYDCRFMRDSLQEHFIKKEDAIYWKNRIIDNNNKIHYKEIGIYQ
jgi:hypothetical protein